MKVAAVGTWMGDFVTAWMVRIIILHFKRNTFAGFKGRKRAEERKHNFLKYSSISTQTSGKLAKAKQHYDRIFN